MKLPSDLKGIFMNYQHELGAPKIPICGKFPFSLRFDGKSLTFYPGWAEARYKGVSGRPDQNGRFS